MTPDKIVLVIIDTAGGKLSGKTLLQKRAYFLSVLQGIDLGYRAHFYGPFSSEVEDGLAHLKSLGFVEERSIGFGAGDQVGFEIRRYDYAVTDDGKQILDNLKKQHHSEYQEIENALERMQRAGDTGDYMSLSIAAKTFYILSSQGQSMTTDEISEEAAKLGWTVTSDFIHQAASFLKKLGLAETE